MIYRTQVWEVVVNETRTITAKFVSFMNLGTTFVTVNGLPLLPEAEKVYDIQGENACLEIKAEIKFGVKVAEPSLVLVDGNLLRIEFFECI